MTTEIENIPKDWSRYELNIRCAMSSPVANLILTEPKLCPKYDEQKGYCSECPHFMGIDTRKVNVAYVGDVFSGCCHLLISETGKGE